jgi:hypothetical protein
MALHTLSLIAAVVSCVFATGSVVFTVLNIRGMRTARAALVAQQRALQTVAEDFVGRVMTGQVVAVTTEGDFGMLVVEPHGPNALRVSVRAFETERTH